MKAYRWTARIPTHMSTQPIPPMIPTHVIILDYVFHNHNDVATFELTFMCDPDALPFRNCVPLERAV